MTIKILMAGLLAILAAGVSDVWAAGIRSESVVTVTAVKGTGRSGGTGFEVEAPSGRRYTITNAHVCADAVGGLMDLFSEVRAKVYFRAKVVKVDEENDLCALSPVPAPRAIPLGHSPRINQTITIMGHPGLGELTISAGSVVWTMAGEAYATAPVAPGSSGSPVYDNQGALVGVVQALNTQTGYSYFISVEVLKGFLHNL